MKIGKDNSMAQMKRASIGTISIAFFSCPNLASATSTIPVDFYGSLFLVGTIFISIFVLVSQFLPFENGYESTSQRVGFGIGAAIVGAVTAGLFFRYVLH
ncbi:hypothetical protein N8198_05395 [Gammaproteobacteria bacterium]|nr:hypothetical protein [Gammaproteobacteria bacterium]